MRSVSCCLKNYYATWVRARQEQLQADVSRVRSRDPLVLLEGEPQTKDTAKLREQSIPVYWMKRKVIVWCGSGGFEPEPAVEPT